MSKKVVIIGQAVKFPGTAMHNTLVGIDKKKTNRVTCRRRNANGTFSWFVYSRINTYIDLP